MIVRSQLHICTVILKRFDFCILITVPAYDNFLQFAGQKDGATRCAQIVQLLLANHVDHAVSDPLVAVQLDASNAFCSVSRQPQFDVLAGTNSLDRAL